MPYQFAIVGCGNIASRHAENIVKVGKLIAVCDIIPDRAAAFGQKYGVPCYDNLATLLDDHRPTVLVVCTPNGTHYDNIRLALHAGCNVLCEKPLTHASDKARELINLATTVGKKIFVVKQNRYNPPVVLVKKLLEQNKLGKVAAFQINCFWNRPDSYYHHSWHGTLSQDGGILYTQFSHFVDLLYWLLGDLQAASGWRANYFHTDSVEFEDAGAAVLVMRSGAVGNINYNVNTYAQNMEGSFTIFGQKGTVKIGGQYLNHLEYFAVASEQRPSLAPGNTSNAYSNYQGSMSNHDQVYKELVKALDDPDYRFVEAAEALKSVEMIEMIYAASPFVNLAP